MALLFVPLTTLAIQDLKGAEIGQGSGLNNMMRQLGGSFGIAALTTLIHIRQGFHRSNLLVNVNEYNPAFTERFNGFVNNFIAKGYTYLDAKTLATKAVEGAVTKHRCYLLTVMLTGLSGSFSLLNPFIVPAEIQKKCCRSGGPALIHYKNGH